MHFVVKSRKKTAYIAGMFAVGEYNLDVLK